MQDLCVTATRDHNVYASFRPSIATKDAETRSKMNTVEVWGGKRTYRKSWAGNLLMWSDLTLDPSFKVIRG